MKVCVIGDGLRASGLAAKLAQTKAELSLILPDPQDAPHLEAIQDNGLTLIEGEGYVNLDLIASDTSAFLGPQDVVIVTRGQVPQATALLAPVTGAGTELVAEPGAVAGAEAAALTLTMEISPYGPGIVKLDPGTALSLKAAAGQMPKLGEVMGLAGLPLIRS